MLHPDKVFFTDKLSFEQMVELVKYKSQKENISITENILVLELKDGIYIRSKIFEFTELFIDSDDMLTDISGEHFKQITRDIKFPINQFGDINLVRFKIGF
jgi:hypothetical protein